ncbi:thioredoxin family protein [Wenyingzhuangia sp. IMCC45574]
MPNLSDAIYSTLRNSFSYNEYQEKMLAFVETKSSSGTDQSEEMVKYTKLNQSRMKRLNKTLTIDDDSLKTIHSINEKYTWLVLTESWCGDAAQTMPVMHKIAEQTPNIDLKVAFRDENSTLMNYFLTNGNAAIPRLIILNEQGKVVGDWGPRPTTATKKVNDFKREHGGLTTEFKEQLQIWYNKNKGVDTLNDLKVLMINIVIKNETVLFDK